MRDRADLEESLVGYMVAPSEGVREDMVVENGRVRDSEAIVERGSTDGVPVHEFELRTKGHFGRSEAYTKKRMRYLRIAVD